jgi:hypothetical protein
MKAEDKKKVNELIEKLKLALQNLQEKTEETNNKLKEI